MLAESNLADVRKAEYRVAVLPFGATEPHNLHLPYGTDTLEADWIGKTICERAWNEGARVVLLPTIPYGTETNQREFPFSLNLNPSTLQIIIEDLIRSLVQSGIDRVVILNSHGGNDFKPVLREMYGKIPCHLFLCNWFQMVRDECLRILDHQDDHAGEMETSLILAYRPDLVYLDQADNGETRSTRFEAINHGWVSMTRPWHLLTTNSGSGNPSSATAEKGRELMEVIARRLVPFLVDLAKSQPDEQFPF